MKSKQSIVSEVIRALSEYSDPKRIEKLISYCPTSQRVLGVTNPQLQSVLKELKQLYTQWGAGDWIELSKALVFSEIFECQIMAYELLGRNRKLLEALSYTDLEDLWRNLDNWASVDGFSVGVYGVLWGRGVVKDQHIKKLLDSENFWDRRVAVVASVALNLKSRGGKGDTSRTIWVCEQVVDDHHDMIQKALSWSLRELSKRDKSAVTEFMNSKQDRLARRVVREVQHKLDFGTKN